MNKKEKEIKKEKHTEEKGGRQRVRAMEVGVPVQEEASGTRQWRMTVGIWVPRLRIGERRRVPSTGERGEQRWEEEGREEGQEEGTQRRKEEGSSFDWDDPDDPEEEARPIPL